MKCKQTLHYFVLVKTLKILISLYFCSQTLDLISITMTPVHTSFSLKSRYFILIIVHNISNKQKLIALQHGMIDLFSDGLFKPGPYFRFKEVT